MKSELVPRVDKNDTVIELVTRQEAYQNGWIHRGVHGIIKNEQGKYLIPKRSSHKSTWPGYYDLGMAETLHPNETYFEALSRGLREELSLIATDTTQLVREQYYQEYFWEEYKVFGMISLYFVQVSQEPTFADGEVQSAQWLSEDDVSDLIRKEKTNCAPWLLGDWEFYLEYKQK